MRVNEQQTKGCRARRISRRPKNRKKVRGSFKLIFAEPQPLLILSHCQPYYARDGIVPFEPIIDGLA